MDDKPKYTGLINKEPYGVKTLPAAFRRGQHFEQLMVLKFKNANSKQG
jgi:hypothetical protein